MAKVAAKAESNGAVFHGGILGAGSGLETEKCAKVIRAGNVKGD